MLVGWPAAQHVAALPARTIACCAWARACRGLSRRSSGQIGFWTTWLCWRWRKSRNSFVKRNKWAAVFAKSAGKDLHQACWRGTGWSWRHVGSVGAAEQIASNKLAAWTINRLGPSPVGPELRWLARLQASPVYVVCVCVCVFLASEHLFAQTRTGKFVRESARVTGRPPSQLVADCGLQGES